MNAPCTSTRVERLSPGARALLGLLHPAGAPAAARALTPEAWEETLATALRHGVAPLLHRALQSGGALAGLPDQVRVRLDEERRATALANLRNLGQFRRIAQALRERDIPVIALKGLHLAELVYRDISLRPMSDLDILVPHAQLDHAITALLAMEFELNRGLPNGYDIGLTHRRLGILVEVHWALGPPSESHAPPIDEIWRLAVPASLADAYALAMSPELLLLHVCTHLAHHHLFAFDLRALCDIAEIVRAHPALDWGYVVDQCRRNGGGRGVAAALRLAHDHVGAKVPADVLATIGGDTLDAELLADALEQLEAFTGIAYELRTSPKLIALKSPIGWRGKIATLWKRILVPRAELALIYGVPEQSARINLYYAVRLRDLVRRYAGSARELMGSGPQLAASTARGARLAQWINEA